MDQKIIQGILITGTAVGRNVDGLVNGHGSHLDMKGAKVERNHGAKTYCLKLCAPRQFLRFETQISV